MKKFLATTVFCLALVPTGTFAATAYTAFPDGNAMMSVNVSTSSASAPFASCSPGVAWLKQFVLNVNNLSTLFPLHIRAIGSCLNTSGGLTMGSLSNSDLYGPTAPTIADTGTAYTVAWTMQVYVAGVWIPGGTLLFSVPKADL